MSSIAITGATGLVGHHILKKLTENDMTVVALHRGAEPSWPGKVIGKSGDVMDPVSLQDAFAGCETVIHSAGYVSFNPRRRNQVFEVNTEGTRNVVNACLYNGVKNLVHISSVAALGRKHNEIANEETKWTGIDTSDYARSKYLAELEAFRGAEEGLTVSVVCPSVVLAGSHRHQSSAALFDYVWNERKFSTAGTLNYVDVRDVADVVFALCRNPLAGQKFILSAGNIPYHDFFRQVAKQFNKKAPSLKVGSTILYWAGLAEEFRSLLFNREPTVTRHMAKVAAQSFRYDNSKAEKVLKLKFRNLDETIQWCCADYMRNVSSNN